MGFGSYDESEQENQNFDSDDQSGESVTTGEHTHDGRVEYEIEASNDELLDKLKDIKE